MHDVSPSQSGGRGAEKCGKKFRATIQLYLLMLLTASTFFQSVYPLESVKHLKHWVKG